MYPVDFYGNRIVDCAKKNFQLVKEEFSGGYTVQFEYFQNSKWIAQSRKLSATTLVDAVKEMKRKTGITPLTIKRYRRVEQAIAEYDYLSPEISI